MISANGRLPAHRYTPQVTPRWPRGSEPASMPDHVVTLAWHAMPHKIRSQIPELTCEACHVHNRRGFGGNDGIFLGMDLWSISPLYITFRFDTCMEHLDICRMHF